MFDFKKWREERKLTQAQAGAFLCATRSFWVSLEAGEGNANRIRVITWALKYYDTHKTMFKDMVQHLSPDTICVFMTKRREETGMTFKEQSLEAGFGKSTLSNMRRENDRWSNVTDLTKALVCAYMLECNGRSRESIAADFDESGEAPEVLESVTVPATVNAPERTFTPVDVVVEVAGVPVEMPQGEPESFEHVKPIMIDGEPMWIVADVCRAIGHSNSRDAVKLIDGDDVRKIYATDSVGRNVEQWACNEPGLYTLLLRSNLPKAKPFKKWVTSEVLPSIRKTGSYQQPLKAPTIIDALELQLKAARQLEAQQRQIDALAARVDQLGEGGTSADEVVDKLMEIDGLKTDLHQLVHDIVHTAKHLPDMHPMKADYSSYSKVWHKAFKAASPPVSAKAEYRKEHQIQPSIDVLRTALAFIQNTTLPELMTETPSQLSLNI